MARQEVAITRFDGESMQVKNDCVTIEAPLEIHQNDASLVMMMRTPASEGGEANENQRDDTELVLGWLWSETGSFPVEATSVASFPGGDVDRLQVRSTVDFAARLSERSLFSSTSCGLCGRKEAGDLMEAKPAPPPHEQPLFSAQIVGALPEKLRDSQAVFDVTGGIHGAALFDASGTPLFLREDVGRHNAVDKVIGTALQRGLRQGPQHLLCVSGRISFEIVYKAASLEIPVIVAVSAPTSLAIEFAERSRITLCGFTREGKFNIYSHAHRIV